MKFKPSIIGISETWLTDKRYFLHQLDGYKFIESNSNRNCGGCGFFILSSITFEPLHEYKICDLNTDQLWISVTLPSGKKICLASIYRRPAKDSSSFEDKFLGSLEKLQRKNMSYIITGDFNINLSNTSNNVLNYIDSYTSLGCTQLIKSHTRVVHNQTPSLLDHIYTNFLNTDIMAYTVLSDLSDHFPTIAFLNLKPPAKHKPTEVVRRDLSCFDADRFLSDLQLLVGHSQILSLTDYQAAFEDFISKYEKLINSHAPLKPLSKKSNRNINNPWMNNEIKTLIRKKDKLYKKWLILKTDSSHKSYTSSRNKVTRAIKNAKKIYHSKLFEKIGGNTKLIWKNVNKLVNYKGNHKSTQTQSIQDNSGNIIHNQQLISNNFNDFFINIGENLAKSFPSNTHLDHSPNSNYFPSKSLFLKPITPTEIESIIKDLKPGKSTPSYCAAIKFLHLASPVISQFLSFIFNKYMNAGIFPDCLKLSEVIPVYKSGCKLSVSNFRPISLLNPFSKVFEKCLYSRLYKYCSLHNILSANQFGFREKMSTENAVINICDDICCHLNNNKTVCSIFLDLKKAFDTVNHSILMHKLYRYGIRGIAFNLFSNYLCNRMQYSLVNNIKSSSQAVTCGIPQGSILGPLLFLSIYIKDKICGYVCMWLCMWLAGYVCLDLSVRRAYGQSIS